RSLRRRRIGLRQPPPEQERQNVASRLRRSRMSARQSSFTPDDITIAPRFCVSSAVLLQNPAAIRLRPGAESPYPRIQVRRFQALIDGVRSLSTISVGLPRRERG